MKDDRTGVAAMAPAELAAAIRAADTRGDQREALRLLAVKVAWVRAARAGGRVAP